MTAHIELEIIHEGEAKSQLEKFDLEDSNHRLVLVVGFGNQIFDEVRATAHTVEVAILFASLLRAGGYEESDKDATSTTSKLGQTGDICLSAPSPYVWLSPTTIAGEHIELPPPEKSSRLPADGSTALTSNVEHPDLTAPEDIPSHKPLNSADFTEVKIDVPKRLEAASLGMLVPRAIAHTIDVALLICFFMLFRRLTGLGYESSDALFLLGCLVALSYFLLCEWRWGKTLGKRALGLAVVDREGNPISFGQSLGRICSGRSRQAWAPFAS